MSELLQLLTMTPHPLPMSMVRAHSVITPEDSDCDFHCPRCHLDLPASDFYFDAARGKHRTVCKVCSEKKSNGYAKRMSK